MILRSLALHSLLLLLLLLLLLELSPSLAAGQVCKTFNLPTVTRAACFMCYT